ncbi:MAG TPA: phytanoyl-CoA dioxygenase family protein [Rhizomicrobium sp.]|nr:phytanoyl-CoA dioxygenase family protein [Rhizomicrobium sp.]
MGNLLSDAEIATYRRDGYLVPRFALRGDELTKLQAMTERLLANNPHITDGTIGSPHLVNGKGSQNVVTESGWLDVARHPKILDMMEQVVGLDLVLWTSTMFHKAPEIGPATPWHRDGVFYPIEPLATTTVWIAVYESTLENACLRVIPGSHRAQQVGHHVTGHWSERAGGGAIAPEEIDEAQAVDVELKPGQMVIFDIYTAHGSRPNIGRRPRAGYAVRFFPATSHYDHLASDEDYKVAGGVRNRELILVRGRDRAGNRFGPVDERALVAP